MDSKQYAEQMLNKCAEMIVEALKNMSIEDINMYQIGYEKGKADAIEFILDKIIYPLLDECDIGLWEDISYIPLAEKWVEAIRNNPYPKVKNHNEARKKDLKKWIADQLKEQADEITRR